MSDKGNIYTFTPKKPRDIAFSCPDCGGQTWAIWMNAYPMEENLKMHRLELNCQTDGCDFVIPMIGAMPEFVEITDPDAPQA